jgi:hypothetical protein
MPIREANTALQAFEAVLTLGDGREATKELLATIEGYNRDDCLSAVRLRDWLEDRRLGVESQRGQALPRPPTKPGEPGEELSEQLARTRALAALAISTPIPRPTPVMNQILLVVMFLSSCIVVQLTLIRAFH